MLDSVIESVIEGGDYDLAELLGVIDRRWAEGLISEAARDALVEVARARAKPQASYAPVPERMTALELAVRDLEARVAALEGSGGGGSGGGEQEPPEWSQPAGAHDAYAKGDRVTFAGKVWESTVDGNVWSPATYPAGWQEVQ